MPAYLSVHEVSLRQLRSGEMPWAGLANFARLLDDEVFWLSLRHTFVFVAVSVVLEVVLALGIALVIDDERVWISRVTRALISCRGRCRPSSTGCCGRSSSTRSTGT